MATVSKDLYDRLIANRPLKFSAEDVNYRDSVEEGEENYCHTCIHFYTRKVDGFTTCEIFRPADDSPVDPNYVCDFHSVNGTDFPLLDEDE